MYDPQLQGTKQLEVEHHDQCMAFFVLTQLLFFMHELWTLNFRVASKETDAGVTINCEFSLLGPCSSILDSMCLAD